MRPPRTRTAREWRAITARSLALPLLGAVTMLSACSPERPGEQASEVGQASEHARLRAEVEALRERLKARLAEDSLVQRIAADTADVLIGIRTPLLQQIMAAGTRSYLGRVQLHLEPDLVIHESESVGLRLGPVMLKAGEWRVQVTIERLEAVLSADTVSLAVADSNRLDVVIPVQTRDGNGRAQIHFEWDAAVATGLICRSFEVSETFSGRVAPRRYDVRGSFVLAAEGDRIVARPHQTGPRWIVSPQPSAAAWSRVREILDRQNHIFRCGLALSPDGVERTLRELLQRGFRFRLPDSVLKPIPLPAAIREELAVGDRSLRVAVRPVGLHLTPQALWYSAAVEVGDVEPGDPAFGRREEGSEPDAARTSEEPPRPSETVPQASEDVSSKAM